MWYEDSCPECKANNWFDNGDPEDMTAFDITAVKCWKCNHVWRLSDDGTEIDEDEAECAEVGRNFKEVKK